MFAEENEVSKNAFGGTEITKRSLGMLIPDELTEDFQIIPSRVRDLDQTKIRVWWQHDNADDPECSPMKEKFKFQKIVFSSNFQMNDFVNHFKLDLDEKFQVIETPIEPFNLNDIKKSKDGSIRIVYFSTPQRGLEILVPVFEKLAERFDNIHLDVYSSFQIYGWSDLDKQFEPLYDRIRNHPRMRYVGFLPYDKLRKEIASAHILAYPCIWKETSCRVLMESMSAGLMAVHPNFGALADTSGGLTTMYQFYSDPNKHAQQLYNYLDFAISNIHSEDTANYLKFVKAYADTRFNISKISNQWKFLLEVLKLQYPTVESRKFSTDTTIYRTG